MFGYMQDVLVWGVVLSLFAIAAAFAAEDRGKHLLRVLLGLTPRGHKIDILGSVPRDNGDWRLVGTLAEVDRIASDRAGRATERVG